MTTHGLTDWTTTSEALHRAASILGILHKTLSDPRPNHLHLPLRIRPWGLASSIFPNGAAAGLDFGRGEVRYSQGSGKELGLPLADHTQSSLFESLSQAMKTDGLDGALVGVDAHLPEGGLEATEPLAVNLDTASAYADLQYGVFTGIARFRAGLEGNMTPVILWPHHMDVSTLWFHPANEDATEAGPHLSFGLAPFTKGHFDLPYLYAYAHPYPEPFDAPELPDPARWHTEGWRGAVVTFDELSTVGDPAGFAEGIFTGVHAVLAPLLDG